MAVLKPYLQDKLKVLSIRHVSTQIHWINGLYLNPNSFKLFNLKFQCGFSVLVDSIKEDMWMQNLRWVSQ